MEPGVQSGLQSGCWRPAGALKVQVAADQQRTSPWRDSPPITHRCPCGDGLAIGVLSVVMFGRLRAAGHRVLSERVRQFSERVSHTML